jgi:hypothetical protein
MAADSADKSKRTGRQFVPTDVAHVDMGVDVSMMHNHQNPKVIKVLSPLAIVSILS